MGVAIDKGLGGVITSPTLLRPVLTWSQHNYQRFLKNVRYFETEGCCPSTLLRGKASMKKNEFTFSIQNDNEKWRTSSDWKTTMHEMQQKIFTQIISTKFRLTENAYVSQLFSEGAQMVDEKPNGMFGCNTPSFDSLDFYEDKCLSKLSVQTNNQMHITYRRTGYFPAFTFRSLCFTYSFCSSTSAFYP